MRISNIQLFQILKARLVEKETKGLVAFVKSRVKTELIGKVDILTIKEDLANSKADLIKWMFVFWFGQIAATIGFVLLFMNK